MRVNPAWHLYPRSQGAWGGPERPAPPPPGPLKLQICRPLRAKRQLQRPGICQTKGRNWWGTLPETNIFAPEKWCLGDDPASFCGKRPIFRCEVLVSERVPSIGNDHRSNRLEATFKKGICVRSLEGKSFGGGVGAFSEIGLELVKVYNCFWWWQLKLFLDFLPLLDGEMIQFDEHIFQMGSNHQLDLLLVVVLDVVSVSFLIG